MSQSRKLIFSTDQENLRASHHTREEVLPLGEFTTEFLNTVDRRIHLTMQFPLGAGERGDNITETDPVADNHNVDVACGRRSASRH